MPALSKRKQLELQGWAFKPVPTFFAEGVLGYNSQTGFKSPAFYDHRRPAAWIVTPPHGAPCGERRFNHASPARAVHWAWGQAQCPQDDVEASGMTGLLALMSAAQSTGIVSEIREQHAHCGTRADAELIGTCREYLGCERIARDAREAPTASRAEARGQAQVVSDAVREQNRLLPTILKLPAKTREGVALKARVIAALFASQKGLKSEAVRSMAEDVAAVMGEQRS